MSTDFYNAEKESFDFRAVRRRNSGSKKHDGPQASAPALPHGLFSYRSAFLRNLLAFDIIPLIQPAVSQTDTGSICLLSVQPEGHRILPGQKLQPVPA